MDDIFENIEEYNPNKKRKMLIAFGDMIADMLSDKKLNPIATELFITQSYFHLPENFGLDWTKENFSKLYLIIHQICSLNTLCVFTKNVLQNYILFLVMDATLASNNPSRFRKNLLERI